jgi:cytochrome c oxidase cbb3-type subunit 4
MSGHLNYEALRHFADSWGLLFMTLVFLGLVGWTFRKGASRHHDKAANMIFEDDDHG